MGFTFIFWSEIVDFLAYFCNKAPFRITPEVSHTQLTVHFDANDRTNYLRGTKEVAKCQNESMGYQVFISLILLSLIDLKFTVDMGFEPYAVDENRTRASSVIARRSYPYTMLYPSENESCNTIKNPCGYYSDISLVKLKFRKNIWMSFLGFANKGWT